MSGSVIRKSSRTALKESKVLLSFINLGRALKSRGPILANEWYLRVLAYMLFDLSCGTMCVRGSRTPWYKENTKAVSEDFRLTVHEADLDLRIADDDKE